MSKSLQGKAKGEFFKWYLIVFLGLDNPNKPNVFRAKEKEFEDMHPSAQWGIVQDWFYSVGIQCDTIPMYHTNDTIIGYIGVTTKNTHWKVGGEIPFDAIQEARTAAIEKAVEIYNERK